MFSKTICLNPYPVTTGKVMGLLNIVVDNEETYSLKD